MHPRSQRRSQSLQPNGADYWELQDKYSQPLRWHPEYAAYDHSDTTYFNGNGDVSPTRPSVYLEAIPESHENHHQMLEPPNHGYENFNPRFLSPYYGAGGMSKMRRHSEGDLLAHDDRQQRQSPRSDRGYRGGFMEGLEAPGTGEPRFKSRRASLASDSHSQLSDRTALSSRSGHSEGRSPGSAESLLNGRRRGSESADAGSARSSKQRRASEPFPTPSKGRRPSETGEEAIRTGRTGGDGSPELKDGTRCHSEGQNGVPGVRRASEPTRSDRRPSEIPDNVSERRSTRIPGDGDSASRKEERRSLQSRRPSSQHSALSDSASQRSPASRLDSTAATFAAIEIPLELLDSPVARVKKLLGPVIMFLLVATLAASLGAAVYFATVLQETQENQIEFLQAQIRFRIEKASYEKSIGSFSPQELKGVQTTYCREMDSIYQSSHFKDAYRGCEVLSIREEAINFTLFFTEDATERDIVNVIRMSAALQAGNATSQVVQVDQLILDLKDRRVNLVKVKEVESFTKIRSQPAVTHPADMSVQQGTRHTDQTRTAANAASTAPSDGKTGRPSSSTASPKDPCNPCQGLLSGVFPHPSDCRLYVQCLQGRSHVAVCGSGLKFSAQTGLCDVSANCAVFQSDLICPALVNLTSNPDGRQCDNVTRDLVAHESLCDLYYQCQHGTATLRACPTDSVFDPDSQICKSRSAANNCTASNGSRGGEGSGTSAQTGLAPPPTSPSPTPPQYDYPSRPAYNRDPCKTAPEVGLFPHPDDCGLYFLCSGRASQTVACPDRRVYLPSTKTCVDVSPGRLRCPDLEPCKGRDSGYVPHPHDCARFLQCRQGREEMLSCPDKFVWNPGKNTCEIRSEKSVCPPARESTGR